MGLLGRVGRFHCATFVKLPVMFATDDQITVLMLDQPGNVILCGNAPIHNHHAEGGAASPFSIFSRVMASETFPSNMRETPDKSAASNTNPNVISGQSLRFSLEWPRFALPLPDNFPSK